MQKHLVEPQVIAAVADVVAHPHGRRVIAQEFDRAINLTGDAAKERRRVLEAERTRLTTERDRVVAAIARGVLADAEATGVLENLRAQLGVATAELERLRFGNRQLKRLVAERDRLVALATDFASQARRLHGTALRELLRPWLQDAVMGKARRTLTGAARAHRRPVLQLTSGPGRD